MAKTRYMVEKTGQTYTVYAKEPTSAWVVLRCIALWSFMICTLGIGVIILLFLALLLEVSYSDISVLNWLFPPKNDWERVRSHEPTLESAIMWVEEQKVKEVYYL